jgi:hypothetical protein
MSLTRDQILAIEDRKTAEVKTPEWGDGASVFVRTLSGAERDELENAIIKARAAGIGNARARFCAAFACSEEGAPLFTAADVDALTNKSGAALSRILDAGLALNAMREKDVKELEKN